MSGGNTYVCSKHKASGNADQHETCTHMLQLINSSTLSGIHGFLNTSKQQVISYSRPLIVWLKSSAPNREAVHQHLNPASCVAKEAGLASVCCVGAWGLGLQWTICPWVVGTTLSLVAMQLGGLLPEAGQQLLAVCHPKGIETASIICKQSESRVLIYASMQPISKQNLMGCL